MNAAADSSASAGALQIRVHSQLTQTFQVQLCNPTIALRHKLYVWMWATLCQCHDSAVEPRSLPETTEATQAKRM